MPFSSPPPRYVSVIGLDEEEPSSTTTKKSSSRSKSRKSQQNTGQQGPKVAPITLRNSSFNAEEDNDAGLPSYDEALNREGDTQEQQQQQESIATVSGSSNSASATGGVMRVSMV